MRERAGRRSRDFAEAPMYEWGCIVSARCVLTTIQYSLWPTTLPLLARTLTVWCLDCAATRRRRTDGAALSSQPSLGPYTEHIRWFRSVSGEGKERVFTVGEKSILSKFQKHSHSKIDTECASSSSPSRGRHIFHRFVEILPFHPSNYLPTSFRVCP